MSDRRLLTTQQVADRIGITTATVLRRVDDGKLPAFRIASNALRFDPDEVDAFLEGTRTVPGRLDGPNPRSW